MEFIFTVVFSLVAFGLGYAVGVLNTEYAYDNDEPEIIIVEKNKEE